MTTSKKEWRVVRILRVGIGGSYEFTEAERICDELSATHGDGEYSLVHVSAPVDGEVFPDGEIFLNKP